MSIQHNYLRMVRKQSPLVQSDIAFILKLPDYSSISRWEVGERSPTIEGLFVYHLLFTMPFESLYERQKNEAMEEVTKRITLLIEHLRTLSSDAKVAGRISFLEAVLTRLTS